MTIHPEHSDYMPVAEFYKDSSIFITGGTGFLGKVLVEKLLWSCPGIKNIYLLMRPKRGQNVATRLAELIKSPILHRLRKARPEDLNKIVPIIGDVAEPELGISKSDQKLLIETVSVVFHAAAMIKFNETLKLAVTINLIGTKQLVKLCHHMLKLKALIYVSTAYCNCDKDEVKEVIYPPPYDPEKIMQCIEWMDDKLIKTITPVIIGNRPNTYTFTKALAESVLLTESKNLPVAIVRPSIVLSARCEPVPGWVDGWAGPAGLLGAGGLGLFRTAYCHGGKVADMIPVDMVINLLICAAWHRAREPSKDITVYNCCTGLQKPILWKNFVALCYGYLRKHPLNDAVWYPDLRCNSNRIFNMLCIFILHVLNAHILDLFFRLSGKKPKAAEMSIDTYLLHETGKQKQSHQELRRNSCRKSRMDKETAYLSDNYSV
ncbi:putative fatty acyl-CoA reductase CG5065 isoform X2 [Anabrus simplex]|uniref:putative fatty acyl-CoA reductase CG5065 isoform X2 n=1 Tax=Anabrus simplex TaxID=316456 RepID=UPI0035A3CFF1